MANEPERFPARIAFRQAAGGGLSWVGLLPTPIAAATYVTPGQYVDVRIDDSTGFFALAGREGAGQWELLLRPNGGASEALLSVPIGGHVMVSRALGAGFPMVEARDRNLAIIVTAGALGPALPAMEHRLREGLGARTTLLVGTHAFEGLPARERLDDLAARGADVRIVLSEGSSPRSVNITSGYVQDRLDDLAPQMIFVAGFPAMIDGVRAWAAAHDVAVRSNH